MKIAILGAGNVGGTLGESWAGLGHAVSFGVPNSQDAKYSTLRKSGKMKVLSPIDAVADTDVIVIATPWHAAEALVRSLGDLGNKVVIDCTNAVSFGADGVSLVDLNGHATTEILKACAKNGRFAKTLNQVAAHIMANPKRAEAPALMYVAADDADAKKLAMQLTSELGFDARDAGPLRNARALDYLAILYMHQAFMGPNGRNFVHSISAWSPPS
jgi:8-hydroxy-5-deazaflavin:NADPH oxidoreductase